VPKYFGFDLETYLHQPGLPSPRLVVGSWANSTDERLTLRDETKDLFVKLLTRGDHLVGVNIAFDVGVMAANFPELLPLIFKAGNRGQFHCCSIREALNDIAKGELREKSDDDLDWNRYGMALLMDRHFGEDISAEKTGDVWRFKYAQLDGVELRFWPQEAVDYPKRDARRPLRIFDNQSTYKNLHDEPAQVRAAIAIQLMITWGFRTDGRYIDHLEKEVDALWNAAREEFTRVGIIRPDGTKDKKYLQAWVSRAYNGNPPLSPKRGVCTDRDTLEESGDPVLVKLGTSGKNDKRKTMYIPALRKGVFLPVTPKFNVLVATGRVSSDWQQMPKNGGIRDAIIARPGYVILSCDLGGAELRTMSQRAILDPDVGFSKMAEYLNSGKDTHSHVGAMFLGITYEQFEAEKKGKYRPHRDVAKIWNFGRGGGAGAFAMAYNAKVKENIRLCLTLKRAEKCGDRGLTEGRIQGKVKRVCSTCVMIAKELGELWLKAWPEQDLLFRKASRLTKNGAKVESVTFGSGRVRGDCSYTQWLNNPFQSAVGDGVKAAMWQIAEEAYTDRRSPLWGSRTFLNVHDELLAEVPDDSRRHDASFRIAEILTQAMDRITPDVKNEVVPAIMRRLFKAATDVYSRDGRLRPWWPVDAGKPWAWNDDAEAMALDLAA
jgi:DNA polymerase I